MSTHAAPLAQENLQLYSQPVPGPFFAPKSQSSPPSFTPLPHVAPGAMHAPLLQTRPVAHACPFFDGSAAAWQRCVAEQLVVLHATAAQSVAAFAQLNVQSLSQPFPGPLAIPLSHCSGA